MNLPSGMIRLIRKQGYYYVLRFNDGTCLSMGFNFKRTSFDNAAIFVKSSDAQNAIYAYDASLMMKGAKRDLPTTMKIPL